MHLFKMPAASVPTLSNRGRNEIFVLRVIKIQFYFFRSKNMLI